MHLDSSNLILLVLLVGVGGWVTDYWQNPPGKRVNFSEPEVRPSGSVMLRAFSTTPTRYRYTYLGEQLEMPEDVDREELRFFPLFVDRTLEDEDEDEDEDEMISVAVVPDSGGERLYVDRDDDEDLSDEEPLFFPHERDSMVVRFRGADDPARITRRVLSRVPAYVLGDRADRRQFLELYHTEDGGMAPGVATNWHHIFPTFDGAPDTFYYVYRENFRRGRLFVRDTTLAIGLADVEGDGLYDSEDDRLYVDADGDGRFELGEHIEVDQTLRARGLQISASRIDPYGSYVYFRRGEVWM